MGLLGWIFTLALAILVLRTLVALVRVRSSLSDDGLEAPLQLAVLKENLLVNAGEANLQRLSDFCKARQLDVDPEGYRPLLQRQRSLRQSKELLADDSALYEEQALWLDQLEPIEFTQARNAHLDADFVSYSRLWLQGVLRYYSDSKIEESLGALESTAHYHPDFPIAAAKVRELYDAYKTLCHRRDSSGADPHSLEELRQAKEQWVSAVEDAMPDNSEA